MSWVHHASWKWNELTDIFLNIFTEFRDMFVVKKNIQTYNLLCKKPGCYHRSSKGQVTEKIF